MADEVPTKITRSNKGATEAKQPMVGQNGCNGCTTCVNTDGKIAVKVRNIVLLYISMQYGV